MIVDYGKDPLRRIEDLGIEVADGMRAVELRHTSSKNGSADLEPQLEDPASNMPLTAAVSLMMRTERPLRCGNLHELIEYTPQTISGQLIVALNATVTIGNRMHFFGLNCNGHVELETYPLDAPLPDGAKLLAFGD